jgi:hypothetical protein
LDPEDGPLSGNSLVWTSSLSGGAFGTGTSISTSALPVGEQVISLEATDSQGLNASDQIVITVRELPGSARGTVRRANDESGLANVEVVLWSAGVEVLAETTNETGSYLFESIPPGAYTLRLRDESVPRLAEYSGPSELSLTLGSGEAVSSLDFRLLLPEVTVRPTLDPVSISVGESTRLLLQVDMRNIPFALAGVEATIRWSDPVAEFQAGSSSNPAGWDLDLWEEPSAGNEFLLIAADQDGLLADIVSAIEFRLQGSATGTSPIEVDLRGLAAYQGDEILDLEREAYVVVQSANFEVR